MYNLSGAPDTKLFLRNRRLTKNKIALGKIYMICHTIYDKIDVISLTVASKGPLMKRKKAFYSISAVAKMFSVHQQTIRLYEKQGLICPERSDGNTRLFSEEDVNKLEEVIHLTHQLGINLAGVEMILRLKKKIDKMQKDMNKLFESTKEQLDDEGEQTKVAAKETAQKLIKLQQLPKSPAKAPVTRNEPEPEQQPVDIDNWDIEYND